MYNGITRPNADKGSCINNMFVKTNIPDIKAFKLLSCITDHYPLILTCNVEKPQSTNKHYYHYPRSKWISPGIIKSCLKKEKMYKMWRQDPGNMTLKQRYQSYAKVLEKIILKAKRNYHIAEAEKASTNKKNYGIISKKKLAKSL